MYAGWGVAIFVTVTFGWSTAAEPPLLVKVSSDGLHLSLQPWFRIRSVTIPWGKVRGVMFFRKRSGLFYTFTYSAPNVLLGWRELTVEATVFETFMQWLPTGTLDKIQQVRFNERPEGAPTSFEGGVPIAYTVNMLLAVMSLFTTIFAFLEYYPNLQGEAIFPIGGLIAGFGTIVTVFGMDAQKARLVYWGFLVLFLAMIVVNLTAFL